MDLILLMFLFAGILLFSSFLFKEVNIIFIIFSGLLLILSSSLLFTDTLKLTNYNNEIYNYNYSYNPPLLLNSTQMPIYYNNTETNIISWFSLLLGIYILVLAGFDLKNGIRDR